MAVNVYDAVVRTYTGKIAAPCRFPHLAPRSGVKLVASTYYPVGTLIGETAATAGKYGIYIRIANVALTSNVATVTTVGPHGLSVGDSVVVTAVTATTINGTVTVVSVPSTTTFTYAKTATDVTSAADTGSVVRNTGTATPLAIIAQDCITDASGNIYAGQQVGGDQGEILTDVSAYFGGFWKMADVVGLDTNAITALGAHILYSTVALGAGEFVF